MLHHSEDPDATNKLILSLGIHQFCLSSLYNLFRPVPHTLQTERWNTALEDHIKIETLRLKLHYTDPSSALKLKA
jgi:hypothetical protein